MAINIKQTFTLQQDMRAQRGSRGIALLTINLDVRWGWVVNATPRHATPRHGRFSPGKDSVPIE